MSLQLLTERRSEQIAGVLCCYDRILIQGTLPGLCYAEGMTGYLYAHQVRIFNYPRWAQPFREALRENAERLAAENGLEIEFIRRPKSFRKEDKIQQVLKQRGRHPGLVWIFSALEPCSTYQPWHNKSTGRTYLRPGDGKCLHYYFYFIDEELGLCYVRVPTWCPFRLQVYLNGHHRLACRLQRKQIGHTLLDNAFIQIGDWERTQKIADDWPAEKLHRKLDEWAERYCPVIRQLEVRYHWSLEQVEFSTDLLFHRRQDLQAIYDPLTRTAIHTVKPDHIATFLGRKQLSPLYQGEVGNRFNTRIEGTRIKHSMGPVSIKMYDKFGLILRIETTVNDVSFFPHYRTVEQRDGRTVTQWARMKKSIYSLPALREALQAANRRYLEFLSSLDDPRAGIDRLEKVSEPALEKDRSYPGLNFFSAADQQLIETLARGEFNLRGFQNKSLRAHLREKTSGQVSRLLKGLRLHGIVKKVGHTYRYYLTPLGKQTIAAGLKLKNLVLIPQLALAPVR
jgi:hypothetical protein